jgi:hypothetical protein
MTMRSTLTMAVAAGEAGATVHPVRTYVSSGLVRPCVTTADSYLLCEEGCVARLRQITSATRVAEIGALFSALDGNDAAPPVTHRADDRGVRARQAAADDRRTTAARPPGTRGSTAELINREPA